MTDPAYYDWSNQDAWAPGAWAEGAWLAGAFAPGAWHQPSGGGGGPPEWVPASATTFADFVNGHYWDGAAIVTDPSDMFTSDDDDGDPWNPTLIVPGTGYSAPSGEAAGKYKGAALASLGTEFVVVFELNLTNPSSANFFSLAYNGLWDDSHTVVNATIVGAVAHIYDQPNSHVATGQFDALVAGVNRVAFRVSSAKLAVSVNGLDTVSVADPIYPTAVSVYSFYSGSPNCIIRSVTTYPNSTADADLPALTTVTA